MSDRCRYRSRDSVRQTDESVSRSRLGQASVDIFNSCFGMRSTCPAVLACVADLFKADAARGPALISHTARPARRRWSDWTDLNFQSTSAHARARSSWRNYFDGPQST